MTFFNHLRGKGSNFWCPPTSSTHGQGWGPRGGGPGAEKKLLLACGQLAAGFDPGGGREVNNDP